MLRAGLLGEWLTNREGELTRGLERGSFGCAFRGNQALLLKLCWASALIIHLSCAPGFDGDFK